ncbi:MAG: hypothetical protein HY272_03180 [Gammaproteobacteria bacterium]|nr:hypothetical protein [Gammaproteobacteria bacterium]
MALTLRYRLIVLAAIVTGAGIAMDMLHGDDNLAEVVTPVSPPDAPLTEPKIADSVTLSMQTKLSALQEKKPSSQIADAFKTHTWAKPLPPITASMGPPPAPTAPPLPLTYIGKLTNKSATTIFITWRDQNYAIAQGDVLGDTYRVDSIDQNSITFTYLPLSQQQTLFLGELQ